MRYEKFLLLDSEKESIPEFESGVHIVKNNITQAQAAENMGQCRLIEGIYETICELFEMHDVEMQTSTEGHSFFLIKKPGNYVQTGNESVWLSRKKLKAADPKEIAEALIDLLLHRKEWKNEITYQQVSFD